MRGAWVVARKEVRETLRDWRTLLMMVVLPILLYPVLMVAAEQLALFGMRRVAARPAQVVAVGDTALELLAYLRRDERLDLAVRNAWSDAALRARDVDAVLLLRRGSGEEGTGGATVVFDETDERSRRAQSILRADLETWADSLLARRLAARGLPASFATPLAVADSSIARPAERGGYLLGRFLPMLLIIITLFGTFYPAIDMAAGEKERGTLETLLTAPTPSSQIVAGKFLTIAAMGMLAAALNLASMLVTFRIGVFRIARELALEVSLPASAVLLIFLTLLPLSVLFGALFLGVALRSHSFKEAQNSLTPVYTLAILPAMLPLMPGIELSAGLALVPVAGVALLFRDLMSGEAPALPGALAVLSTAVYAALALAFAARAFGREDVLFGAGDARPPAGGVWREWARRLRERTGRVPTDGQVLLFVALVAALNFYAGRALVFRFRELGLLLSEWLLLLLPALLFVALGGFDARRTLSLRRPAARHVAAGVLVIAGGLPLAWFLAWLQSFVLEFPADIAKQLDEMFSARGPGRFVWLLFLAAVTPGICEEAVFRGVLLGGSRDSMTARQAVLLNALIFGLFHVSFETAFRFLPSAWLGLLLAWVVWRTGSLAVSALMHFLNNGTIVLLASLPGLADWASRSDRPPPWFLAPVGLAALAAGLWLLERRPAAEDAA